MRVEVPLHEQVLVKGRSVARELVRRRSRNSKQSSIPSPVLEDNLNISMPGRTARMLRLAAASSNSTAEARSDFVMTATSALLKMVGYLRGLSSPSVTESKTRRRSSPRSYEEGHTKFPTFSMNRKSNRLRSQPTSAF